jgi:hypothetical protein
VPERRLADLAAPPPDRAMPLDRLAGVNAQVLAGRVAADDDQLRRIAERLAGPGPQGCQYSSSTTR